MLLGKFFLNFYKKEEDEESDEENESHHKKKKHHRHNKKDQEEDEVEEKHKEGHVRKRHKPQEEKRRAPQPPVRVDDVTMKFDDVMNTPAVTKKKIEELFGVCWEDIKIFLERLNIFFYKTNTVICIYFIFLYFLVLV